MIDEIYDRNYQAARGQMNADIDRALSRLVKSFGAGIEAINRVQFAAPWRRRDPA